MCACVPACVRTTQKETNTQSEIQPEKDELYFVDKIETIIDNITDRQCTHKQTWSAFMQRTLIKKYA